MAVVMDMAASRVEARPPAKAWSLSVRSGMEGLVPAGKTLLRTYAQVLFSRSPVVGALILLATAVEPRTGAMGLGGAAAASATALLLGLEKEAIEEGAYGYNALLLGLFVGHSFAPSMVGYGAVLFGAAMCVTAAAALRSTVGRSLGLPVLSAPFLMGFFALSGASAWLGLSAAPAEGSGSAGVGGEWLSRVGAASFGLSWVPAGAGLFAKSLGALFFLPRVDAGVLILIALLVHSRIATLLAASGFALAAGIAGRLFGAPEPGIVQAMGLNAALAAMGLGAVWFVPSGHAFALGMWGAAAAIGAYLGLAGPLARVGLPASIVPFHVATLGLLLAMRRRTVDDRPKSVDFLPGTPEENLAYHRTHRARFAGLYPVLFRLPFRGTWVCTQAVDGAHTHQGEWRHGFDFQVRGEDGRFFRDGGESTGDHHCYRLPVLAAAAGTVVLVRSDIPDSPVGEVNVKQSWGNHVIVWHAQGLYSVVAHLAPGSVKVREGQVVSAGDVLGLCGSSGRSPEPHLHFQLQATAEIGAASLPCRFSEVVMESPLSAGDGPPRHAERDAWGDRARAAAEPRARPEGGNHGLRVMRAVEPREGDALRNLVAEEETAAYLPFAPGSEHVYRIDGGVERLVSEVDLFGRSVLRSRDRAATLFFAKEGAMFTALDAVGDERSVVFLLRAALGSVPLEGGESMRFSDTLPARRYENAVARFLGDFVAPFAGDGGLAMEQTARREGSSRVVTGESRGRDRRGRPLVTTRAELVRGVGPVRIEVTARGRRRVAERVAGTGDST